ncbi:MAG: ABC transporter ATP-binding protein [Candidatus Eisenbacteria bacterium]|nr:ABC transporter ATP-binding protein [Candidatus Eisenbacteria bacterium]
MISEQRPPHDRGAAAMEGDPALSVEDVGKLYSPARLPWRPAGGPQATQALRGVSFRVRKGETIGLLGPNGAGKTTLLKIVSTLLYADSGRVLVHGFDVRRQATQARRTMGLVTCDERTFYWRLTGLQNLSFFATLHGLRPRQWRPRADELLEALGLTQAASRPYHSYSSGMKQKLAIARGLLGDPRLVLYDEPTRSLDPLSARNIRSWIVAHRAKDPSQTHLIATNQLSEAEELCDRVLIINRGSLIAMGTIAEIRERWQRGDFQVHRITVRGLPGLAGLAADPGVGLQEVGLVSSDADVAVIRVRTVKGGGALSAVLDRILKSGGLIIGVDAEQVPFDDVFCSLVLGQAADPTAAAGSRGAA